MADDLQLLAKFLTESDGFSQSMLENDKKKPVEKKDESARSRKSDKDVKTTERSFVHENNTFDSSDDEFGENNVALVKNLKKKISSSDSFSSKSNSVTKSWSQKANVVKTTPAVKTSSPADINVFVDPIFRMRLVNPLFSSITLQERAAGRTPVPVHELSRYLLKKDFDKKDWFTAGIVVSKSSKASSKGTLYTILSLSDLHSGLKSFSLFLFSKCHTDLSKIGIATAIGILNPSPLDNRSNKDEAALTIRSPDQVIVWGTSKDYGTCKSVKKNGEVCNAFVNVHVCKTCIYHLNSEYKKFSQRIPTSFSKVEKNSRNPKKGVFFNESAGSLQPAKRNLTMVAKDRAIINSLMNSDSNKPLSSVENTSKKKEAENQPTFFETRLANMSQNAPSSSNNGPMKFMDVFSKDSSTSPSSFAQKSKRISRIFTDTSDKTNGSTKLETKVKEGSSAKTIPKKSSSNVSSGEMIDFENVKKPTVKKEKNFTYEDFLALKKDRSKATIEDNIETPPLKKMKLSQESESKPCSGKKVDLELSFSFDPEITLLNRQTDPNSAALKGLGTGSNASPASLLSAVKSFLPKNHREKAKDKALAYVKKHGPMLNPVVAPKARKSLEKFKEPEEKPKAELATKSAEFERLLNLKSRNSSLVAAADVAAQEEYFDKLEKKEELENKMTTTFKVETKAYVCFDCKYTWYSLSERCFKEKHKTKCITTNKRFFMCGNCKLKKTILDRVPKGACDRCGAYAWEKAAMMNARKVELPVPKLSIRGDEEACYGNAVAGNLNLLVPDEDK